MTGKGDVAATTDGPQYPMVDLFTGGTMLPLMFVNAAATCYLLSLTAPLAFMEADESARGHQTAYGLAAEVSKCSGNRSVTDFDPTAEVGCAVPSATRHFLQIQLDKETWMSMKKSQRR